MAADRPPHVAGGDETQNPNSDSQTNVDNIGATEAILMNHIVAPPPAPLERISTRGWSLEHILAMGRRFRNVPRATHQDATRAISTFEENGIPLIIEDLHKHSEWPQEDFNPAWLKKHGPKEISVRNIHDWSDKFLSLDKFLEQSRAAPKFTSSEEQERLYGKDAECPEQWSQWLHNSKVIPPSLTPDNNPQNLLSSRHVETLMCYLGIGDTFTPCHKDLCASSGQNLMCYTENDGSSFWFMTKASDAPEASKYFQELKQELDHETHVITVEELSNAPFDVYIAEQKLGDLVLVPPRSCHQVVNYGGITIKTSWSRMTLKGLEAAYYHELPIYRRVCRPEIYRVKSTIYSSLVKQKNSLASLRSRHRRQRHVVASLEKLLPTSLALLELFDSILLEEYPPKHRKIRCLQSDRLSSPLSDSSDFLSADIDELTCDFCGADIFQSFFECLTCVAPEAKVKHGDGCVICPGCYIEGRSCSCVNMVPMQFRPVQELVDVRDRVAGLLSLHDPTKQIPQFNDILAIPSRAGTFRAACVLQEIRKNDKREQRTCSRAKSHTSHVVSGSWVLMCNKCHRGTCFTHTLRSQKLHSADALFIHSADPSHEEHHGHHTQSAMKYEEGRELFFSSQKEGTKPDISHQRVHLAEQYQTCKPINLHFTQAGWYDSYIRAIPVTEDTNPSHDSLGLPLSPLTELDSASSFTADPPLPIDTSSSDVLTPSSVKRKRTILDFVDVPKRRFLK